MREVHSESYLGDGAYIACDEWGGIIISANDKVSGSPTDIVYLESGCIESLKRYLEKEGL
jgi:hypothetical protein